MRKSEGIVEDTHGNPITGPFVRWEALPSTERDGEITIWRVGSERCWLLTVEITDDFTVAPQVHRSEQVVQVLRGALRLRSVARQVVRIAVSPERQLDETVPVVACPGVGVVVGGVELRRLGEKDVRSEPDDVLLQLDTPLAALV